MPTINKEQTSIELSLTPKWTKTFSKDVESLNYLKKLDKILNFLEYFKRISFERPVKYLDTDEIRQDFVREEIMATKMAFPSSKLKELFGLETLVVWVSDPLPEDLSSEPYSFSGTFLYLIETLTDRNQYRATYSGCSALQLISNQFPLS